MTEPRTDIARQSEMKPETLDPGKLDGLTTLNRARYQSGFVSVNERQGAPEMMNQCHTCTCTMHGIAPVPVVLVPSRCLQVVPVPAALSYGRVWIQGSKSISAEESHGAANTGGESAKFAPEHHFASVWSLEMRECWEYMYEVDEAIFRSQASYLASSRSEALRHCSPSCMDTNANTYMYSHLLPELVGLHASCFMLHASPVFAPYPPLCSTLPTRRIESLTLNLISWSVASGDTTACSAAGMPVGSRTKGNWVACKITAYKRSGYGGPMQARASLPLRALAEAAPWS
ncbi:hypothetical protein V8C40DRAFT_286199 [Trichoderma camerunense]